MIVEAFPFLISAGVKKCGINIKEHEFGLFNGIDDFTEFSGNEIKLSQCVFTHVVSLVLNKRLMSFTAPI